MCIRYLEQFLVSEIVFNTVEFSEGAVEHGSMGSGMRLSPALPLTHGFGQILFYFINFSV